MAYFKIYAANGTTEVTSGAPNNYGTLNRDDEQVSSWVLNVVKADNGLKSSGNSTVTVIDSTGTDSSSLFQLAAFTTGDTSAPAATPAAYGDDLTISGVIDDTTGQKFWSRRKAGPAEEPATDTTAIIRVTGVVVPE